MDHSTHLQIAAKIHFALLRQYGEDIEIGALMKNEGDAREVLWVCEACGDPELVSLARQFKTAVKALGKHAAPAQPCAPTKRPVARHDGPFQEAPWDRNTVALGAPRALGLDHPPQAPATASWLRPPAWFKRAANA